MKDRDTLARIIQRLDGMELTPSVQERRDRAFRYFSRTFQQGISASLINSIPNPEATALKEAMKDLRLNPRIDKKQLRLVSEEIERLRDRAKREP